MEDTNKGCVGPDSENAGYDDKCKGCPYRKLCMAKRFKGAKKKLEKEKEDIKNNLSNVKHKILVLSGKGGVGKSSFSSQLALILANFKNEEEDEESDSEDEEIDQVGVLDIDLCGPSIPTIFQLEDKEIRKSSVGISPVYFTDNLGVISIDFLLKEKSNAVIWRGPQKNGLILEFLRDVYWGDDGLDYLIIDTPPGTSDEHLTVCNYLKNCDLDGAVIITTPQDVSCIDVQREINFCKKSKINILGIVENMSGFVCPKCKTVSEIFKSSEIGGGEGMAKKYGVDFLGRIPLDPNLMKASENGESVIHKFPKSETAKNLRSISEKIKSKINKK